jgi:hypothetical protein
MKAIIAVLTVGGLAMVGNTASAHAQSSGLPRTAFFIGLGGSINSVDFGDRGIFAQGVSNVYQNGTLVAYGAAGGPVEVNSDTQSTLAPTAQLGYFRHFTNSSWLWGAKFSYSYLGVTGTKENIAVPQIGSFTSANSSSFGGNVVVRSYETTLNQHMTLMPFIGRSFERSFIYFGAGPSLSQTQAKLNGVIGFADINGMHTNITGTPTSFSSSPWVYGGAATVGATYFFDRAWFLDVSYAYAMTKRQASDFSGPFASTTDGYTDTGILSGSYAGREITQSFTVSINKAF